MADIKISQLAEILNPNQEGIFVEVLDTNDTSMASTGTNKKLEVSDVVGAASAASQGYYALLSAFYFGGSATEQEITVDNTDDWVSVSMTPYDSGAQEGTFDYRPTAMQAAQANPITGGGASPMLFSLEGLTLNSFCFFRASLSFEPDEDEGELQARLLFNRHSGTVPSDPFPIEDIAATMTQGADIDYPAEPILPFFVGDSIDTNGIGDAGTCEFQVKSTVAGTLKMRALTWFINK